VKRLRPELVLLLGAGLLFGVGFGVARVRSSPPRLGPRGPTRPALLELAWREHLAGKPAQVLAALGRLDTDGGLPHVRHEAVLLRAVAEQDVVQLEHLAQGPSGVPLAVVAGAQRALARAAGPDARRTTWRERFVREFPRSWAAPSMAASSPR
jgi:hypothetical protein